MTNSIPYITIVEPVLEVTLAGQARIAPWQHIITTEGLKIDSASGSVDIVMSAVKARFRGMPFKEFSISLRIDEKQYFLAHAFNSLRFFAFTERRMFRTPYYFAGIEVSERHLTVQTGGKFVFEATLPDAAVTQRANESNAWQIWLPKAFRKKPDIPHYFYARLEGPTAYHEARSGMVKFPDSAGIPVFEALRDSAFQLQHWMVRNPARHSKSKTY